MKRELFQKVVIAAAVPLAAFFLVVTVLHLDRTVLTVGGVSAVQTVVIDPGHGGSDGGAVGYSGSIEKEMNLDIALKLRDLLRVSGFRVVMTREDDRSIHDEGAETVAEQKRSDLYNRLDLYNADPTAIAVSVHLNQYPDPACRGAQIFYSPNDERSEKLAASVQGAFVRLLQPENTRQIKPADKNLFLLFHAEVPAILCECGFVSNPEEEALLMSEEYRAETAFAIYSGIVDHLAV